MAVTPDTSIEAQVLPEPPVPAIRLPQPVFVLGILQRSGTNYVWDLLRQHPDLAIRMPIVEDHLLKRAGHLDEYVRLVTNGWRSPTLPAFEKDFLARSLGDGIVSYLQSPFPDRRVVTKSPSVDHLALFPKFFPDAQAVIIVRDGRSLVESGVKSFNWTYESSMQRWAAAARTIREFDRTHAGEGRHLIVRYEDLIEDMPTAITGVLEFLGLDVARFDFAAAAALPVRGSSTLRSDAAAGEVHWKPQARPADFDPRRRFEHWDAYKHARFNALAGELQRSFGYDCADVGSGGPVGWSRQRVDDLGWWARTVRRKAYATRDFLRRHRDAGPTSF